MGKKKTKTKQKTEPAEIKITREIDRVIFTVGEKEFFIRNTEISQIIDLNLVQTPGKLMPDRYEESVFIKENPEMFTAKTMAALEFHLKYYNLTQTKRLTGHSEEHLRKYTSCQNKRRKMNQNPEFRRELDKLEKEREDKDKKTGKSSK